MVTVKEATRRRRKRRRRKRAGGSEQEEMRHIKSNDLGLTDAR